MAFSSTNENIKDFRNFENSIFSPFDTQQVLKDEFNDPDVNIYYNKSHVTNTRMFVIVK